ncbi:MAG: fimbrial protein [Marinifilaceae bacterium]
MKKWLIIYVLYSVFMGCANKDNSYDINENAERIITFTLSGNTSNNVTRTLDLPADNEKTINSVSVFFYDDKEIECIFQPTNNQITINDNQITITVPEETFETMIRLAKKLYIVANSKLSDTQMRGKTIAELQQLTQTSTFDVSVDGEYFLMDSDIANVSITEKNNTFGVILLKRAAAKIVVNITDADVVGYTPGNAKVRFTNGVNKTMLGNRYQYLATQTDLFNTERELLENGDANKSYSMDPNKPIYTYSNDWIADISRESYVTVEVMWTNNTTGNSRPYYYRIPFSYINAEPLSKNKVLRNHIYLFDVNVTQLGGLSPDEALNLNANFNLIDWTTNELVTNILEYDYLYVYHPNSIAHNLASYTWEYKSSSSITISNITSKCKQYFSDGTDKIITYSEGNREYPKLIDLGLDKFGKAYISMGAVVPKNYVPLEISFTVTNKAGLSRQVTHQIFPPIYITASYSNGGTSNSDNYPKAGAYSTRTGNVNTNDRYGSNNPGGISGDNFNFFQVNVKSLSEKYTGRLRVGDPTVYHGVHPYFGDTPGYYMTDDTDIAKTTISPSFVVASRRGISTARGFDYAKAKERCARYREAQYPAGSWRLPTYAELALLAELQNDPYSAIKGIFVAASSLSSWGTAWNFHGIKIAEYSFANDPLPIMGNGTGVTAPNLDKSIRCVHDTWRD